MSSQMSSLVPSVPLKFNEWMSNAPYSFIFTAVVGSVLPYLKMNEWTCMASMFLGGIGVVYFLVAYVMDLILPNVDKWDKLSFDEKRKVLTTGLVMLIFIIIFLKNGIKESSLEFIVHVVFAFVFAYLFHVEE